MAKPPHNRTQVGGGEDVDSVDGGDLGECLLGDDDLTNGERRATSSSRTSKPSARSCFTAASIPRWNARLRCGMGPAQAEVAHSPHLPAVSAVIAHSAACRAASAEGEGAQL